MGQTYKQGMFPFLGLPWINDTIYYPPLFGGIAPVQYLLRVVSRLQMLCVAPPPPHPPGGGGGGGGGSDSNIKIKGQMSVLGI